MSRIRSRDTKPELFLRKSLFARGYRYRLQDRRLPGRPDMVFAKYGVVLFFHGCFWHGHHCRLFRPPVTREEFWRTKIHGTRERDDRALRALRAEGWRVLIVWECALRGRSRLDDDAVISSCAAFLLNPLQEFLEIQGCQG